MFVCRPDNPILTEAVASWNKMWVGQLGRIGRSQLEGVCRASEIRMLGEVGEVERTDGTEWEGPMYNV